MNNVTTDAVSGGNTARGAGSPGGTAAGDTATASDNIDLSCDIAGVHFKNPVIAASGTFGFGFDYAPLYDPGELGGISCKGLTLLRKDGNPPPRVAETPSGMLNSVGLQNPGVDAFIADYLPPLVQLRERAGTVIIANLAGATLADYVTAAEKLNCSDIDMVELNISCPNVKQGGATWGVLPALASEVTAAVKAVLTRKPLMVKLTPNVTDVTEIARAVTAAGADAVSLINTLLGMRIDINTRRPVLYNNVGGLSGAAVFPVALRMVWQVARAVDVPVVGMGGVCDARGAVEMILAGATAVQVGTAMFAEPRVTVEILRELREYMAERGYAGIADMRGAVECW